jgi:hypothetical protein
LPTDILIKPYTVNLLGGLLLLSTLHKGRLPALLTFIKGFYFLFVLDSKTDMLKAKFWIQVGVRIWEGQNAPRRKITINAPLILKMRDIIFFCGQTT